METKKFDLELALHSPCSSSLVSSTDHHSSTCLIPSVDQDHQLMREASDDKPHQQPLTIFYNGQVCVTSVNELQARTILMVARREMEERTVRRHKSDSVPNLVQFAHPISTATGSLSMKRSLQRFLQKRMHRAQAASTPYHR